MKKKKQSLTEALIDAHEKELQESQRKTKLNKELYENERLKHQNTTHGARNSDIVLKLLMEAITNFDNERKALQDMNDKQDKKIKFKELKNEDLLEQNMKLTKVVDTMQGIVKKEDTSQKRLQRVLLKEREICKSYSIISKLDMDTPDYLTFMAEMGKTLMDQHTIIEELHSHFDDQKSIDEVLVELSIMNSENIRSNASTLLLDSCQSLMQTQSVSLSMLRPHLSYIVANQSGINYEEDNTGNIIEARMCKCLPEVPNDSDVQTLSVKFSCLDGHATSDGKLQIFEVACDKDECPKHIEDKCVDMMTPWSAWFDPYYYLISLNKLQKQSAASLTGAKWPFTGNVFTTFVLSI